MFNSLDFSLHTHPVQYHLNAPPQLFTPHPSAVSVWVLNSGKIAGATIYVSKSLNKFKGLDHQTDSEMKSSVTSSQAPRPLDVQLAQISLVPV